MTDQLNNETTVFLLCAHTSQVKKLNELNKTKFDSLSTSDLLRFSIKSIEETLYATNLFRLDTSYVYKDFVCFDVELERINNDPFIRKFMRTYFFRLYAFSENTRPYFFNYIYYAKTEKKEIHLIIIKQKVYNDLTRPRCLYDTKYQFETSRFFCLNQCKY